MLHPNLNEIVLAKLFIRLLIFHEVVMKLNENSTMQYEFGSASKLIVTLALLISYSSTANSLFSPDTPIITYNSPTGKTIKITSPENFGYDRFGTEYLCDVIGGSNGQDIATARGLIGSIYTTFQQMEFSQYCKLFYQDNQFLNVGDSKSKRKQKKTIDITNQLINLAYNIENTKLQQTKKQESECHNIIAKVINRDLLFFDAALKSNDKKILNESLNSDNYSISSINPVCKNTTEYSTVLQQFNQKRSQVELKLASLDRPKQEPKTKVVTKVQSNKKIKKSTIGNLELCKAAIGMAFGHSPSIIEKITMSGSTVSVGYIREMDNTQWDYECKFKGNEIIWRALPGSTTKYIGRWRDSYDTGDPKLTYSTDGNKVTITESFNDGSENSKTFSF